MTAITSASGRSSLWRLAALVAGGLLSVVGLTLAVRRTFTAIGGWPNASVDLDVYLRAARALSHGDNPYDRSLYPADPYAYPPFFGDVIAIFRLVLGDGQLWTIWALLGAGCLFAAIALMMRGFGRKIDWAWVLLGFGVIIFGRIARSDFFHVQPHFILVLLLVVGVHQFHKGNTITGALAWGAVIVCKPFVGALALGLIRRGEWKKAVATVVASGVMFAVSFLPILPKAVEAFNGWLTASKWHTSYPNVAKIANETFYGLFSRLFSENRFTTPWADAPQIVPWLALPFVAIALAGIYFGASSKSQLARVPAAERSANDLMEAMVVLGLAMSCGPLMEAPHVLMLLPGVAGSALIAYRRWEENSPVKQRWFAAAAMWALTFSLFAIPVSLPIVSAYDWPHLSGLMILVTGKFGFMILAACLLSVFALMGDRAVRSGSALTSFSRPKFLKAAS